jgi:hypothetical protein
MSDAKHERIKQALEDLLEPDDEITYLIRRDDAGAIVVATAEQGVPSDLRESHPELYGQMVAASEQIGDAGSCLLTIILLVIGGVICAALDQGWLLGLTDSEVVRGLLQAFASWWGNALVFLVMFGLSMPVDTMLKRRAYRRHRDRILYTADAAHIRPHALLAHIEGDGSVEALASWLKKDANLEYHDTGLT